MQTSFFSCKHAKKSTVRKVLFFILFSATSLVFIYNFQIIPPLVPLAKATASNEINKEIQSVIRTCIAEQDCTNIVKLNYDNSGNVVSLQTNAATVATLTTSITENCIRELGKNDSLNIAIPLGNLTGSAFFTGKGPRINIKILFTKRIHCQIKNEFLESGINQTLHRIVIVVESEACALVPMATQAITVFTEYCIAETVIVGTVPEAYTKIDRISEDVKESDIDDIFDFGASVK